MGDRQPSSYHLQTLAENRALQDKLHTLQTDINELWRIVNRTYSLWKREQLETRRLRAQIERLEAISLKWHPTPHLLAAHQGLQHHRCLQPHHSHDQIQTDFGAKLNDLDQLAVKDGRQPQGPRLM